MACGFDGVPRVGLRWSVGCVVFLGLGEFFFLWVDRMGFMSRQRYSEEFKVQVVREVAREGPHDRFCRLIVRSCGVEKWTAGSPAAGRSTPPATTAGRPPRRPGSRN